MPEILEISATLFSASDFGPLLASIATIRFTSQVDRRLIKCLNLFLSEWRDGDGFQ